MPKDDDEASFSRARCCVLPCGLPVWLGVLPLHHIGWGSCIHNERGAPKVVSHDAKLPVA